MAYIDKNIWLATNFAAKIIKETGFRNKAIRIASNYYDVNESDVEKELNKRVSKGLKGKKRGAMRKYKFDGIIYVESEAFGIEEINITSKIFKATSRENAEKRIFKELQEKYGEFPKGNSYYSGCFGGFKDIEKDLKEV